jgi:hypothetical protein
VELPDARLASGSSDNTIRVWAQKEAGRSDSPWECVQKSDTQRGGVGPLAVLASGGLMSAGGDALVKVWG